MLTLGSSNIKDTFSDVPLVYQDTVARPAEEKILHRIPAAVPSTGSKIKGAKRVLRPKCILEFGGIRWTWFFKCYMLGQSDRSHNNQVTSCKNLELSFLATAWKS